MIEYLIRTKGQASEILLAATGREQASEAVRWIAQGYTLRLEFSAANLLRAVLLEDTGGEHRRIAMRKLARRAASLDVDTAQVLIGTQKITPPMAAVLLGAGWGRRNETAELAPIFAGRLYTEKNLEELANYAAALTAAGEGKAEVL